MTKRTLQFASVAIFAASTAFAGTPGRILPPTPAPKPCVVSSVSFKTCPQQHPIPPVPNVKR